jgi:hypothetical protein
MSDLGEKRSVKSGPGLLSQWSEMLSGLDPKNQVVGGNEMMTKKRMRNVRVVMEMKVMKAGVVVVMSGAEQ